MTYQRIRCQDMRAQNPKCMRNASTWILEKVNFAPFLGGEASMMVMDHPYISYFEIFPKGWNR